jgi:hypothetical protein
MSGTQSYRNLQPNELVSELISNIESELPSFTGSEEFVEIVFAKKNENQHSKAFCVFMTNTYQSRFCFQGENVQTGNNTVDIGVYKGANLIFTIEAKVLPTPLTGDRKEHEYIYGKGGGIQRFKDEKHGVDNRDKLLPHNGMIAYVKEQNFDHWHATINQWVLDASWHVGEKLRKISFSKIARLVSEHDRKGGSVVTLHHFWVVVN